MPTAPSVAPPLFALRLCLLLSLLLAVCACAGASPGSALADDAATESRYPLLPLSLLNAEQRARFITLAQSELCPCDGILDSLDACLQRDNGGCRLSLQIAKGAMRKMKEGESDSDISDHIIQSVQLAKKVYTFDLKQTPFKGADPSKAKVVIVEFADFQCPHCARAAKTMREVISDSDQVTVYFKQYPLKMHEHARAAAQAALAAHRQGKFWEMHDALMENQETISPDNIQAWAKSLDLDMARLAADMASPDIDAIINADVLAGDDADLTGTPTIFVNGVRFDGSLEELEEAVKDRLKEP
jgi:protein-disulfide isomerase